VSQALAQRTRLTSVADAVLTGLVASGVDTIFGFPGETSLPLYLAAQLRPDLQHILARCPRCAGYMAEAYARVSGRVGVCDAPGGIGSPHVAPALLEGFNSSTPMLFLASGVSRAGRGRWATGECDQQQMFAPVTKRRVRLEVPDGAAQRIRAAAREAASPRGGPVFVEIPADILTMGVPDQSADSIPVYQPYRPVPGPGVIAEVARCVRLACQPVIVAGGGIHLSGAAYSLRRLVAETGLPVATTLNGKGAVDENLPNALGVTGAKGAFATNDFVFAADCVIAIGTKLGDKSTDRYRWPHPGQTLIHVDCDPAELDRFGHPSIAVLSDAGEFCRALVGELSGYRYHGPRFDADQPFWERGLTDHLCRRITRELGDEDIVVADASVASGWAGAAIRLRGARQRLLTPRGSGSIGYALPAALGAKQARPRARVFAIGGDGGLAMAVHEFETAVRARLPVTYFLLNNQRLGLIDKHAVELHGFQPVSAEFTPLDWQRIAAAFGWRSILVRSAGELDACWEEAVSGSQPTLVECVVPASECAPDFIITKQGGERP
jgi:acetolactate synthase-1/2/3 large subunit